MKKENEKFEERDNVWTEMRSILGLEMSMDFWERVSITDDTLTLWV